jgi:DNA polymerase-3 subunit alpha
MFLIYDTETTGLPRNYEAPVSDLENWPRLVQLAWQLHDAKGRLTNAGNHLVKPEGFTIPYNAEKLHGISTEMATKEGEELTKVLGAFLADLGKAAVVVGHNIDFDINIIRAEFLRTGLEDGLENKPQVCTKMESIDHCALPGGRGGGYKWPTLAELHQKLFGAAFGDAHDASADVQATARCFFELVRLGVIGAEKAGLSQNELQEFILHNPRPVEPANIDTKRFRQATGTRTVEQRPGPPTVSTGSYCHLHVHSQYSVLQATPDVSEIIDRAAALKMPAVALTDHANLFGAYSFVSEAREKRIKPILGCELYIAAERTRKRFTKDNPDIRHSQVLLAKDIRGYRNLSRLSSLGYIEGLYGLFPRIDKELVRQYRDGLIALTGGLHSEIPELILNIGETQAEEAFRFWHGLFGEDFYVQINRHGLEEENRVNEVLIRLAGKYGVKVVAANNVYYMERNHAELHDILLCILNAEYQSTPVGESRGQRFGFPNDEFYFKSQEEMRELFRDLPEAIDNIAEIVAKVEVYDLHEKPLMPDFPIPDGFRDADEFLRHQTLEGAKSRYEEITDELKDRIDFELETIRRMGYPGYFLIVQDILDDARKNRVSVGPGRGSAAGSVVAYCLRITDIDPLKFNLLFERFLNPDRISLPDIDIDFDEDGRDLVLKRVVEKYGSGRVAQIITFGKMQPKLAIRDIARVKQLSLAESDRLAKLVPGAPGITFRRAYSDVPDLEREKTSGEQLVKETLSVAERLEGTIRNTGTHACGIIIGKDDLIDHIPLSITKDTDALATQYEGSQIEHVGMLKMDFLGLKTLSIIKDTLENIRLSKSIEVDIESIPFDDAETYQLYSKGDTNGIFQFESDGMKKYLRDLKPNRFEDLIAMNALYRPGPMEYIPNYIRRKHGKEKIDYLLPDMEEILRETYGITVYQEQVMLLSQKLAGFSKGEADSLRKAMGKKKKEILDEMKSKFVEGARSRGHQLQVIEKIWQDWEAFANYAFNKSHSTCYAVVSYRMAWLKAHYPAEFMAAVLSRHLSDIKKITFFTEECRHLGIMVLGPDVNESMLNFVVNKSGEIRFGMAAIKGIGEGAVESIVEERLRNGPYRSIFDFAKRVNLRTVNKRAFEALAMAGAFDSFAEAHRSQYFYRENNEDSIFLEKVIRHASLFQEKQTASQHSLFGDEVSVELPDPKMPACEPWSKHQRLIFEKEVTGFYISGHPLDDYKPEISAFCSTTLEDLNGGLTKYQNKTVSFAGMINSAEHRTSKSGNPYGIFEVEDFTDTFRLSLFSDEYLKFKHLLVPGAYVHLQARVEANRNNPGRLEVRVNNMMLLAETMERFCKSISLTVSLGDLSEDLASGLVQMLKAHPGKCEIKLRVRDADEGLSVDLRPRKFKVNPGSIVRSLEKQALFEYRLN